MNNKDTLDRIKQYIEDGELSFLIGAGFSRNVNKEAYLLWGDLLKDAIWKMFGSGNRATREKKVITKAEKEHGYLGIASMMVNKAGYHEIIDTYIESKIPYLKTIRNKPTLVLNGNHLPNVVNSECHTLLKKLNIQNIYTFNYDNALEYFLGDESKTENEEEITKLESEAKTLRTNLCELRSKEASLIENYEELKKYNNGSKEDGTVEKSLENTKAEGELEEDLKQVKEDIKNNRERIKEVNNNIETRKLKRKTFYNVVKDSYDISLSAKRKSIYKIHGSLRETVDSDYGFDGDNHTQYIITQEDYDNYNEKHGAFVSMMRIDLLRSRFCIMGVSGGDANFLAWINWVKDVLDKTQARSGSNEKHQSYFVYSNSDNMPKDMLLMLKNHFIEPVILKDYFPDSRTDEERIKSFLEYIQPMSNNDSSRFADLWREIEAPRVRQKTIKPINELTANELLKLSGLYMFNKPQSIIQYSARNVQSANYFYLREDASITERMIYAAALQSTLMPIDLTCEMKDLEQMAKEKEPGIRDIFYSACRRMVLLNNRYKYNKKLIKGDLYTNLLLNLYNYQFPSTADILKLSKKSGLDYIRQYSLLKLISSDADFLWECEAKDFNSPQELVLAVDWLKYFGFNNTSLNKSADDFKHQWNLFSLYDYCQAYLAAMKRKKEINTYGSLSNTFYFDAFTSDIINAAILLNSFIELGICFAGNSVVSDDEWLEIVRALKERYTNALVFYTLVRGSNDKVIKTVAQEMMYNEKSRVFLKDILNNIIKSIVANDTPDAYKGKMALFASEILPAVKTNSWSTLLITNAEKILDIADSFGEFSEQTKGMYSFVSKSLEYIEGTELKLRLLDRLFEIDELDDRFESHYNLMAISARKKLNKKAFSSHIEKMVSFAEKVRKANSRQGYYIILNLLILVNKKQKHVLLEILEERALDDAFMTNVYVAHIKDYPQLIKSFKEKYLNRQDLWHTGISDKHVSIGSGSVDVAMIDDYLHFNEAEVRIIYDDLKMFIGKINSIFLRERGNFEDKGWLSSENNFREQVMDMRLFVHNHHKQLSKLDDFEEVNDMIIKSYERCFFDKSIYQLIADDEIYRAIKRIIVESRMNGIEHYRLEYEQIIGRIITKDSKELSVAFRHISSSIINNSGFFNTEDFQKLLDAVLKVYAPYFDTTKAVNWDLKGCQKEIAERSLVVIADTIKKWGKTDEFWNNYKKVFQ